MADVFLSYASEDRARVRPLAEALQQKGFNVWWDRSLAAGQDYAAIIERELKSAKAVIVVWTQASVLSNFVRDEAGRARDEGRLVPVMLDRTDIPLGFGAFQAEDFSKWSGGANAPQMQLLEEALRAKIEGRDVDGGAIARKRSRLGARIRIVSVLTVIALIVVIAVFGRDLLFPQAPQESEAARLLRLLEDGTITPEQAILLAQLLEAGALGEQQVASADESPAAAPSDSASMGAEAQLASVSEAEFDSSAREAYRTAFLAVARHPDASVRLAAAQMSQDSTREAAMQTLWQYAQSHPDDPLVDEIYLLCGSVGEANDLPLGQQALEVATNLSPRDPAVWRMLSRSYNRNNRSVEAEAAAVVSEGVEAQNQGDSAQAEARLQEALPNLTTPELRAPVVSQLGQLAETRNDFTSASARYAEAYRLREESAGEQPAAGAQLALEADAQQLVVALDRSGRTREACDRLRQAQEEHDVAAPNQELVDRCETQYRTQFRNNRVEQSPALRQRVIAPEQRLAPATTP